MSFVDQTGLERVLTKLKTFIDSKVNKSGDTMTGRLTAPEVVATVYAYIPSIINEGDSSRYVHRIDLGKPLFDHCDFYEYGGIWNFYQNVSGAKDESTLIASIQPDGFHGNVIGKATSADSVPSLTNDDIDAAFAEVFD